MSSLRGLVRRVGPGPATPPLDDAFIAYVRERLEPVLVPSGFVFSRADAGVHRGGRTTAVRFAVDAEPFVTRYPGVVGHLRSEGSALELWTELDVDRGSVSFRIEDWQLPALLAAVRAGPGAPPRRRRTDETMGLIGWDAALDRGVELLRRLFDAAAPR